MKFIFHENGHSKVWSLFTKVVGLITRKPTKLSLHFSDVSMIFYAFYKNQPTPKTI
jgi:hypothetical protein